MKDYLTFVHARHRTKSKYGTLCLLVEDKKVEEYRDQHFSRFERIDAVRFPSIFLIHAVKDTFICCRLY